MIWLPINKYESRYLISRVGKVKIVSTGKLMSIQTNESGYSHVNLWDGNKIEKAYIHRLVAIHYIPNPQNKPEVNHLDFDPRNNHYTNLEWATESENRLHSVKYRGVFGSAKRKIPVMCISKEGLLINTYDCISDAERATNINQQNISKVISGERKYAGGYLWKTV